LEKIHATGRTITQITKYCVLVVLLRSVIIFCPLTVGAGHNTQHGTSQNTAKLDRETEELHHKHVNMDVSRAIQQARQAKGFTQKELATVSTSYLLTELRLLPP